MNAPTSGAAARKPLASKSELEAEISNLLEQEGQNSDLSRGRRRTYQVPCRPADVKFDR